MISRSRSLSRIAAALAMSTAFSLAPAGAFAAAIHQSSGSVEIVAPSSTHPVFNALALWNPEKDEACLLSATTLRQQDSPDKPWASQSDCQVWKPKVSPEQGIYEVKWENGESSAPLIVSANPSLKPKSHIVVLVPDYTWQAYNLQAGGNFYFQNGSRKLGEDFSNGKLSLLRPNNFVRVGDPVNWPTVTQEFPQENPIAFLRQNFGSVDVIQQSKLDEFHYNLSEYSLIVVYGHDEYWTAAIRNEIQAAVEHGSSLLNLSGNTGYRHIIREGEAIHFETPSASHKKTSLWGEATGTVSPARLLGVQYLGQPFNQNSRLPRKLSPSAYQNLLNFGFPKAIPRATAPRVLQGLRVTGGLGTVFKGTGLKKGDWFGFRSKSMGYELDGVPETSTGDPAPEAKTEWGTDLPQTYAETWLHPYGDKKQYSRAGMLSFTKFGRGKVFSMGSVGWTQALVAGDPTVAQITKNAVELLTEK